MRYLHRFEDSADARRFSGYLRTRGIGSQVEEEEGQSVLWLEDDQHLEAARESLDTFLSRPDAPEYEQAARAAERMPAPAPRPARRRHRVIDVRTNWHMASRGRHGLTVTLIVLCGVVAALSFLGGPQGSELLNWLRIAPVLNADGVWFTPGLRPILHGEVWRLVTPIFLHFGVLHLVFNLFWLRDLGTAVETRLGPVRLGLLILAVAILSNLAQYFWKGPNFGGMSGVVYGLLGYVWIRGRLDPAGPLAIPHSTVVIMLVWLVVCMTGMLGPVANAAHVVGLAVGMAAAGGQWLVGRARGRG